MKNFKNKIHNTKGFTLIEVLAVVIILGVILMVTIPAISKYTENSRRETYINIVKNMVNSVTASMTSMKLPFSIEENEGMIIPFTEIELEKESTKYKSPYAPWVEEKSYILIIYDGEKYNYYVSALDENGYAIPLINEKDLNKQSITTDKKVINSNNYSYVSFISNQDSIYSNSVATMKYLDHSNKIVKIMLGYSVYKNGDIVQLKDGSKWFVIKDSGIDEERINLVSYYTMSTIYYGRQSSSNPTYRFDFEKLDEPKYDENVAIYLVSQNIISATREEMTNNGLDVRGATIKMPNISDFGCTLDGCKNITCFKDDGNKPFWTIDIDRKWVLTINSDGLGRATSNHSSYGIRIVIKDFLKSNINKEDVNS